MPRRFGTFVFALFAAAACSRAAQEADERETLYHTESTLTIRVVNHSRLDATIFLVHDGARERMGTVTAATTASFPLRARLLASGDFTLLAEPVGSRRSVSTERLSAAQGSIFTWTLDADLRRGAVFVQE